MIQSRRFYVLGAITFLALLLILASTFMGNERLNTLKNLGKAKDSDHQPWDSDDVPPSQVPTSNNLDWSRFAYVQYATNTPYLCNSVMLFERLHHLGCKADRLLMYPSQFSLDDNSTAEAQLLMKARDEYNVILKPIEVQRRPSRDPTWAESYTKLLAFNQTEYQMVLHLDSDSTVLQSMDELFSVAPAWVAMPRAYWLGFEDRILSSQLLLLQPSKHEFERLMAAITSAGDGDYDMDILNTMYKDSAMILPHRGYDLLTGEFRGSDHARYTGDGQPGWDPDKMFKDAKFLHFSDWPLPKPWLATSQAVEAAKPACGEDPTSNITISCRSTELWASFYADFRQRRKDVCGIAVG